MVLKDVTSILFADRNVRAGVLAALREVYAGRWQRNVGGLLRKLGDFATAANFSVQERR